MKKMTNGKNETLKRISLVFSIAALQLAGAFCRCDALEIPRPLSGPPDIEDYATIEAMVDGVPVYSFSNLCYIYGVCPDLLPGVELQEDNTNPKIKIKPKKSWEIKHNLSGATHEMTVKSPWSDSQPFLPIHLIDGDPDTVWCSWGCQVPDGRPEWIRIDLPMEKVITSVALICSSDFPSTRYNTATNKNYGRSLPKEIEIRLSRDAWHWETVYENKDFSGDPVGETEIKFDPQPAKQIWILASHFPNEVSFAKHVFSIGEVEVRDPNGENLALVSHGAGVTASSKTSSHDNDSFTQRALWGPLQYDLGNKWVRVGPHNGSFTWNYVELEKGKLEIDPWADESITECNRNGVNVIMNLDIAMGNWRYMDSPRKLNWREARFREINNNYEDHPGVAFQNPEMWEGFLRYVEYMARHFKDRVTYFEIGNEWNVCFQPERYMEAFDEIYAIIKREAPQAKVMLGNTAAATQLEDILSCLGRPWETGLRYGHLPLKQNTLIMADSPPVNNATISMDVNNQGHPQEGVFGLVLHYKDADDYIAAVYQANTQQFFFIDDPGYDKGWQKFPRSIAPMSAPELGPDLHLEIRIEGPLAIFTVSDGEHSYETRHTFNDTDLSGPFGLVFHKTRPHHHGAVRVFDNLQILDDQGRTVLHEAFREVDIVKLPLRLRYIYGDENPIKLGWGARIDAVGWHSEGIDRSYVARIKAFKRKCEALGFKGRYFCTEIGPSRGSLYPPGPPNHQTEMQYAKIQIRKLLCNNGMDIMAGPCHPHFTGFHHDQPHTRITWPAQTMTSLHGAASYYVWRTVATIMDDFYAQEFPVIFESKADLMYFTFESGDKSQILIAAWNPETLVDGIAEVRADVIVQGHQAVEVWAIDIFNGTEQALNFSVQDNDTVLKRMLIKDYPTFIRIKKDE